MGLTLSAPTAGCDVHDDRECLPHRLSHKKTGNFWNAKNVPKGSFRLTRQKHIQGLIKNKRNERLITNSYEVTAFLETPCQTTSTKKAMSLVGY